MDLSNLPPIPPRVNVPPTHLGVSEVTPPSPMTHQQGMPGSPPFPATPGAPSLYTQPQPVAPKSTRGRTVLTVILLFMVAILAAGIVMLFQQVTEQGEKLILLELENQKILTENEELHKKIDAKETFNTVANNLFDELHYFDGKPYKELIPTSQYVSLIQSAYNDRDSVDLVDGFTADLQEELDNVIALKTVWDERKVNLSGTSYEGTLDSLSSGYADMELFNTREDNRCDNVEASACVWSNESNMVLMNLDQRDIAATHKSDEWAEWWFNGVVYHEYAHVLQHSNPEALKNHIGVFDNNWELMADCYSATQYSNEMLYFSYNLGCSDVQRKQIDLWLRDITYQTPTVTQE